jgi:hypothetical protein
MSRDDIRLQLQPSARMASAFDSLEFPFRTPRQTTDQCKPECAEVATRLPKVQLISARSNRPSDPISFHPGTSGCA